MLTAQQSSSLHRTSDADNSGTVQQKDSVRTGTDDQKVQVVRVPALSRTSTSGRDKPRVANPN